MDEAMEEKQRLEKMFEQKEAEYDRLIAEAKRKGKEEEEKRKGDEARFQEKIGGLTKEIQQVKETAAQREKEQAERQAKRQEELEKKTGVASHNFLLMGIYHLFFQLSDQNNDRPRPTRLEFSAG